MVSSSSVPTSVSVTAAAPSADCCVDESTWRQRIHDFHLRREKVPADAAPEVVWPASVAACVQTLWREHESILYLAAKGGREDAGRICPLHVLLGEIIPNAASAFPILGAHLPRIVAAITDAAAVNHAPDNFTAAVESACEALPETFQLSTEAKDSLQAELSLLREKLPSEGTLIPVGAAGLVPLFALRVAAVRAAQQAEFRTKITQAANQLEGLLRIASNRADTPGAADTENNFINQAALAEVRSGQPEAATISDTRKKRIVDAIKTLRAGADKNASSVTVVTPLNAAAGEICWADVEVVHSADWHTEALAQFEIHAADAVALIRALSVAELELASAYDEAVHDAKLARIEWRALSADALLQIQPVAVYLNASALTGAAPGCLLQLLRAGVPIQVLIADDAAVPGVDAERISQLRLPLDLGVVAMACHETFVLQSSPTCPAQLLAGLDKMAGALRPGVAIVAAANESESPGCSPGWVRRAAAVASRAQVCFQLDPDAGASGAERFCLGDNPQPEAVWARQLFSPGEGADGVAVPLTYAHAVALDPACAAHFWLIPTEAWDDAQIEIEAYLELFTTVPPERVPYILAVNDAGELQRAIITRELAFACRERAQAWQNLRERAGIHNEHVRRAIAATRAEVEAAAQIDLDAALAEAHAEGADAAIEKIVGALANPGALIAPTGAAMPAASVTAADETTAETVTVDDAINEPTEVAEAVDDDDAEEAYVDSFLCTSCNECTNLNPRLFVYNSENQAEIGDLSAGTYAELVKAAEACPAKCIHPGAAN